MKTTPMFEVAFCAPSLDQLIASLARLKC